MTSGATTKSNPSANRIDETELGRLRKQDYWLVITRNKLLLDLIFVCELPAQVSVRPASSTLRSVRLLQRKARKSNSTSVDRAGCCLLKVCGNTYHCIRRSNSSIISSTGKLFAKESAALANIKS